jgi:two-component system, LytTR family, sensor kinase
MTACDIICAYGSVTGNKERVAEFILRGRYFFLSLKRVLSPYNRRMKRSIILLIHLVFWIISVIIPGILMLTYRAQISQGMVVYQIITQIYYIIVFYFVYLLIVPATIGTSKGILRNLIIFLASVIFLWLIKIGKTIVIDHRFSLDLEKFNIYTPVHYASDLVNVIIYTVFALFLRISINWYEQRRTRSEIVLQEHRMELEFLKAQLNPHFFFNTLNNIYSLVYKKSDEAPAALMKLSDIMRYMLYESKAERVSLDKELENLNNYIELQRLRYRDPDYISFTVEGNISVHQVPPMLLLSFVENAFKHGRKRVENPGIVIKISATDNRLRFLVSNFTLDNKSTEQDKGSGIGLNNTRRRLELLYPGCHDLQISRNSEKFTVSLELFCKQLKTL